MIRAIPLVAIVSLLGVSAAAAQVASSSPVIVTHGEATVKRPADRALLSIAVETRETKAAEARRRSAEAMLALQSALRSVGLAADAIRTTGYVLIPEMEWTNGRGTVRGYLVRNQIDVRVDELDKLGDVIDAANGARNTSVSITGPRFGLKDEAAVENEALRLAVQAAMVRAQSIAAGARRSLGAIVRIEEPSRTGLDIRPEPMLMRTTSAKVEGFETPITPGEIEVRALVTLTVELR
jgi:uncharacterized protein